MAGTFLQIYFRLAYLSSRSATAYYSLPCRPLHSKAQRQSFRYAGQANSENTKINSLTPFATAKHNPRTARKHRTQRSALLRAIVRKEPAGA